MNTHGPRPTLHACAALALLLSASACGGEGTERIVEGARGERLARDRQALQSRIELLEASGRNEELLRATKTLLEEPPRRNWFHLEGLSIAGQELEFLCTQNTPDPRDPEGPIRALDLRRKGHPLPVIAGYAEELTARGIDFLVVPVPSRLQTQPDLLPGVAPRKDCEGGDLGTTRLLLALNEAGVEVLDLLPAFAAARRSAGGGEEAHLYLDYNPHWNPRGVSVAAELIAQRIRELEWFEPGPHQEGRDFFLRAEHLPCSCPQYGPDPDRTVEVLCDRVVDASGKLAHKRDRDSPILLIGDSYSAVYRKEGADVASQLYARLGFELDCISLQQGGANSVWQALARRQDGLRGKKMVIWMFAMNVLGADEMIQVDLFPE